MNELERSAGNASPANRSASADQRALYDRFSAMVYGIILQILPQAHLAQEALLDVFTSPQLATFSKQSGNPALILIRLARVKALEYRQKIGEKDAAQAEPISFSGSCSPEFIFDLSFRQGYSLEVISEQSGIAKPELVKAVREFMEVFRRS
ncbi:hypothetical protein GCM10028803_39870 [Larkinella knui]|uniref:Sigma-70 family RNA polymerase sigma factor n=1 Tax=Larkinella knui TaxID=2025310 RepID=A0A3P1CFE6_9BACT|nr:hypothetical protein [Larkinella knui]RRB11826.1 hypothetical protein EHT87_25515 [Larkinella knui]